MADLLRNRVRERREARELSQVDLAKHARLTRQSISAIEAGRAVPSVDVALRIATALDCQVEELFLPDSEQAQVETEQAALKTSERVVLAYVHGQWVSLPLSGDGLRLAADGIVVSARSRRVVVERLRSVAESMQNVILTGCATGLGILADRL
ncbi:MAG: helix-turn-helix domain-containing protein, partial [Myxococcales bacterium]|nr:helix-turn-helix domain-containing protein [Myxococcales bacterium]